MIAAIYARKSNDEGDRAEEAKSCPRQIEHGRAFAAKHGWTVLEDCIWQDDGISGGTVNRPGLQALLRSLTPKPRFQVLVVMDKDRLSRDMEDGPDLLKQLRRAGVEVWEYLHDRKIGGNNTPTEKFVESVGFYAAEQERYQIGQRTRDELIRKIEHGYAYGPEFYGYINEPVLTGAVDKYGNQERVGCLPKINEAEAKVIRRIFTLRRQGQSYLTISRTLAEDRLPTPSGLGEWSPSTVRAILFRPIYKGLVVWGKKDSWNETRREEAEWTIHPNEALRIVTDQMWDAAHRWDGRSTGGRPPKDGSPYVLSGLAQCAQCGSSLIGWNRGPGRSRVYRCFKRHSQGAKGCDNGLAMPTEVLDLAIINILSKTLDREDVIETIIERAVAGIVEDYTGKDPAKAVQDEIARVEAELKKYAGAIGQAGPLQSLLAEVKAREGRLVTLRAKLGKLTPRKALSKAQVDDLRDSVGAMVDDWRGLLLENPQTARGFLRDVLPERIRLTPGKDGRGAFYKVEGVADVGPLLVRASGKAGIPCVHPGA